MNSLRLRDSGELKSIHFKSKCIEKIKGNSHRDKTYSFSIIKNDGETLSKFDIIDKQRISKIMDYKKDLTSKNNLNRIIDKINIDHIVSQDKIIIQDKITLEKENKNKNNNECGTNKLSTTIKETKNGLDRKITRDDIKRQIQSDLFQTNKGSPLSNKQLLTNHNKIIGDTIICKNICRAIKLKTNTTNKEYFDHLDTKQIKLTKEEKDIYGSRELKGFQQVKILGKGGCGIVWLATDKNNKEYAIKQIVKNTKESTINLSNREYYTQTAKREISMLNYISSLPNKCNHIVSYKWFYESSKDIWIIFEKGGYSLSNLSFKITKGEVIQSGIVYAIKTCRFYHKMMIDLNQFKYLIKSLLEFILFISSYKIVHSDIKPDNILISYVSDSYAISNIKVIDFGSAFFLSNPKSFSSNTPEYMSPEIISLLDRSVSSKEIAKFIKTLSEYPSCIDMWSLGVTLLEIALSCPIWLSYKAKVLIRNETICKTGLFGFKGRELAKIYLKQIEVSNCLHRVLEESVIDDIDERCKFEDFLKKMLQIDYCKRITPFEALSHPFLKLN